MNSNNHNIHKTIRIIAIAMIAFYTTKKKNRSKKESTNVYVDHLIYTYNEQILTMQQLQLAFGIFAVDLGIYSKWYKYFQPTQLITRLQDIGSILE